MKKKIIIAGFAGIGKTELAKKYRNVVDLDSSDYAYDNSMVQHLSLERRKGEVRPSNPNWPDNYIEAIKAATSKYDIVLVWDREDIIKEYLANNINFSLFYPDKSDLNNYVLRYRNRGNSENYIEMKLKQYNERMLFFNKLIVPKTILKDNETLEDYLIRNGYPLSKL